MKRTYIAWIAAFCLGLVSSSSAQIVYSSNVVGFQKVNIENGNQVMASTPFDNVVGTISNLFSGQLTGGFIDTAADNILKWDPNAGASGAYRIFYQIDSGPVAGNWVEKGVGFANDEPVLAGEGIWITNTQTPGTNTVVLVGEVPTDASRSIGVAEGLQMIHNPYPASFSIKDEAISDLTQNAQGGFQKTLSDLVFQWNPDFSAYDLFWLLDNGPIRKWIKEPADPGEPGGFVGENGVADFLLAPGAAIWYQRRPGVGSFTWNINKPYTYP